jgi:hypothetical protein
MERDKINMDMNYKMYALALNQKWSATFTVIGFLREGSQGEIHMTVNNEQTYIFRGDDEKEVLQEAKAMLRLICGE